MHESNFSFFLIVGAVLVVFAKAHGFIRRQDVGDVMYKIQWPGSISLDLPESPDNLEHYPITTADNEKYICTIPPVKKSKKASDEPYKGPNPIELLTPFFHQNSCSLKLESYWTYEVCHGKFVRQYHEEREGKNTRLQEFSLGQLTEAERKILSERYDEIAKSPDKRDKIPTRRFDGVLSPYVEIHMKNGTLCDLSNKPRSIKLFYICQEQGKHEILSLEETSSCEYEAVVLSPEICADPDYGPRGKGVDEINCIPSEGAPELPKALVALEAESLKLRHQKTTDDKPQILYAIFHAGDSQDGVRVEIHQADLTDKIENEFMEPMLDWNSGQSVSDVSTVRSFLNGKQCLHGGNGWWKYEFCYGRYIYQYHKDRDSPKLIVDLGNFDKRAHIKWLEAHPSQRPKPLGQRKELVHFYSGGGFCQNTGHNRQTEVKLKCPENHIGSPSSVSLFLTEPKTCEYILTVESPLICKIIDYADENGLISDEVIMNFDELKTESSSKLQNKDEKSRKKNEL